MNDGVRTGEDAAALSVNCRMRNIGVMTTIRPVDQPGFGSRIFE